MKIKTNYDPRSKTYKAEIRGWILVHAVGFSVFSQNDAVREAQVNYHLRTGKFYRGK